MDNFIQILQWLPIARVKPSTRNHFGGATPFKVQVNFVIPLFGGQIDIDALEKMVKYARGLFLYPKFLQR
jgi:hypothetical protein